MSSVIIKARDNGPFLVEGPVTIVDAAGNQFAVPPGKPAIALCRCGHSQNKPFCDGSHKTCNFLAAERAMAASASAPVPAAAPPAPPT
jgi:CDGSH-type Zn-finger protein